MTDTVSAYAVPLKDLKKYISKKKLELYQVEEVYSERHNAELRERYAGQTDEELGALLNSAREALTATKKQAQELRDREKELSTVLYDVRDEIAERMAERDRQAKRAASASSEKES